jgi:hypothetical protein
MTFTIPMSFGPLRKSQRSLATRIARPVFGGIAGAAASWALYSFIRRGPSMLSDLTSQLREWIPRAKTLLQKMGNQGAPTPTPKPIQKASLPKAIPNPESSLQLKTQLSQPGRDWIHAVLEAMKKEPRDYGFTKVEWTAPLLSQYLEKHHGKSIPVNRIRDALKESGYKWHITRYRKAHH